MQLGLFSLGAVQALAAALTPLCSWLLPHQTLHPPIGQIPAHAVLSLGISLGVVTVWLVFRSSAWAWVLQDLLGISLIVLVLRQFRLPDIKVCSTSNLKHQGTLCAEGVRQLGALLTHMQQCVVPDDSSFAYLLRSASCGRCEEHKHVLRFSTLLSQCKAICVVLKAAVGLWEASTHVCMQLVGLRLVCI